MNVSQAVQREEDQFRVNNVAMSSKHSNMTRRRLDLEEDAIPKRSTSVQTSSKQKTKEPSSSLETSSKSKAPTPKETLIPSDGLVMGREMTKQARAIYNEIYNRGDPETELRAINKLQDELLSFMYEGNNMFFNDTSQLQTSRTCTMFLFHARRQSGLID